MQLHSLYSSQLRDFCDDVRSLSVDVEALEGRAETTLQKSRTRDLMQVSSTIKMSTSNHRRHPDTFHCADRNLHRLKRNPCSRESEHHIQLLLSVSIQQQVVWPGKTPTLLSQTVWFPASSSSEERAPLGLMD